MGIETGRLAYLGASEVAAVLGFSTYSTPYEMWERKSGRAGGPAQTGPMQRGQDLEDMIIAKAITKARGCRVSDRQTEFVDGDRLWLRAHVDGIITLADGSMWVLEAKAPGEHMFRIHKENGLPRDYVCQGLIGSGLARQHRGFERVSGTMFAILDYENWDVEMFPVRFDQESYDAILPRLDKFWGNVLSGTPYEFTPPPKMNVDDGELRRFASSTLEENCYALIQARAEEKGAKTRKDELIESIIEEVGDDVTLAELNGMVRMARPVVEPKPSPDAKKLQSWARDVVAAYERNDQVNLRILCSDRDIDTEFVKVRNPYRRATFTGINDFKGAV